MGNWAGGKWGRWNSEGAAFKRPGGQIRTQANTHACAFCFVYCRAHTGLAFPADEEAAGGLGMGLVAIGAPVDPMVAVGAVEQDGLGSGNQNKLDVGGDARIRARMPRGACCCLNRDGRFQGFRTPRFPMCVLNSVV
jgi:hypothetical protein